jgi:hypothetical protein
MSDKVLLFLDYNYFVKMNELVDAMDSKGKWYKGFIAEEKEN